MTDYDLKLMRSIGEISGSPGVFNAIESLCHEVERLQAERNEFRSALIDMLNHAPRLGPPSDNARRLLSKGGGG